MVSAEELELTFNDRHVRVHHVDKDKDDPQLREVLAQRPEGGSGNRRRRVSNVCTPYSTAPPQVKSPRMVRCLTPEWVTHLPIAPKH